MTAYAKNSPGAPVGRYVKGDTVTDSAGIVWVCVVTGNPAQFDVQGAAAPAAADVTYDNVASGLAAENVQDAVDEVYAAIPVGGGGDLVAHGGTPELTGTTDETLLATIVMPALALGDMVELFFYVVAVISPAEGGTIVCRAIDPVTGPSLFLVGTTNAAIQHERTLRFVVTDLTDPSDAQIFTTSVGTNSGSPPLAVIDFSTIGSQDLDFTAPWDLYIVASLTSAADSIRLRQYSVRALVAS